MVESNKRKVSKWNIIFIVILFAAFMIFAIHIFIDGLKETEASAEYRDIVDLKIEGNIFEMREIDYHFYLIGIEPSEFEFQEKKQPRMGVHAGVYSQDKKKVYVVVVLNDEIIEKLPNKKKIKFGPDDQKPSIHIDLDSVTIDGENAGELSIKDWGIIDGMPRKIDNKPVTKF